MQEEARFPFAHVLHQEAVRALADSRSYERGRHYFDDGRVAPPRRVGSRIEARVRGSTDYDVSIWVKGDGLAYTCTCPHCAEGAFCKHCVAVALAWLARHP